MPKANSHSGITFRFDRCRRLAALVVVAVIVFASDFRKETALVVLLIGLAKAVDAIADVMLSAWQQREEMRVVSAVWMVNAVGSLLLAIVGLILSGNVVWAVAGSAAGSVLALAVASRAHAVLSLW